MPIKSVELAPKVTSQSFNLYLLAPDVNGCLDLYDLNCARFGLDTLASTKQDAVTARVKCKLIDGTTRYYTETLIPEMITGYTSSLMFPEGVIHSPTLAPFLGGNCDLAMALVGDCKNAGEFEVWDTLRLGEAEQTERYVIHDEADIPLKARATVSFSRKIAYHPLIGRKVATDAGLTVYAIGYRRASCVDCERYPERSVFYGGFEGVALKFFKSDDGFATSTSAAPFPFDGGLIAWMTAWVGDTVVQATDNGLIVSVDGGNSYELAVNGVFRAAHYFEDIRTFYAVGDSGAIYYSTNGLNWHNVSNTVFPAASLYDVAYDPLSETVYVVGDDAGDPVVMTLYGDAIGDITADVGITEGVQRVKMLAPGHILIASIGGQMAENCDVIKAGWTNFSIGSGGDTNVILGDRYRTFVSNGNKLWVRSIGDRSGGVNWSALTFASGAGITGVITGGAEFIDRNGAINHLVIGTDDGEIAIVSTI